MQFQTVCGNRLNMLDTAQNVNSKVDYQIYLLTDRFKG